MAQQEVRDANGLQVRRGDYGGSDNGLGRGGGRGARTGGGAGTGAWAVARAEGGAGGGGKGRGEGRGRGRGEGRGRGAGAGPGVGAGAQGISGLRGKERKVGRQVKHDVFFEAIVCNGHTCAPLPPMVPAPLPLYALRLRKQSLHHWTHPCAPLPLLAPLPQVFPEGMHMFQLPFMDDIRSPELEVSVVGPEVRGVACGGPGGEK